MGALRNSRHEKVAQERASGKTHIFAARSAGYDKMTAENCRKLGNRKDILSRIAEIKARVASIEETSQAWVRAKLRKRADDFDLLDAVGLQCVTLLGKDLGMWPNKMEHTGKDGGPLETKDVTYSDQDRARALAAFVAKTRAAGKEKPA